MLLQGAWRKRFQRMVQAWLVSGVGIELALRPADSEGGTDPDTDESGYLQAGRYGPPCFPGRRTLLEFADRCVNASLPKELSGLLFPLTRER
jgi:hypothetical protein